MIKLTESISINPLLVVDMFIDTRHYMNGSTTHLEITMTNGTRHRIEHGWGVNVFAVKDQIERAAQEGKT